MLARDRCDEQLECADVGSRDDSTSSMLFDHLKGQVQRLQEQLLCEQQAREAQVLENQQLKGLLSDYEKRLASFMAVPPVKEDDPCKKGLVEGTPCNLHLASKVKEEQINKWKDQETIKSLRAEVQKVKQELAEELAKRSAAQYVLINKTRELCEVHEKLAAYQLQNATKCQKSQRPCLSAPNLARRGRGSLDGATRNSGGGSLQIPALSAVPRAVSPWSTPQKRDSSFGSPRVIFRPTAKPGYASTGNMTENTNHFSFSTDPGQRLGGRLRVTGGSCTGSSRSIGLLSRSTPGLERRSSGRAFGKYLDQDSPS
eukprot:TRINITY_DN12515_c0_g1_i7.p1 TRINITY_DN12515_c0_g1~~TRINITY_DN12515_c0_g1_i7.p1  ORF type:complete len:314 (-),score=58.90 TRINITY_DN12515_c0_g1_i7:42-983(-)